MPRAGTAVRPGSFWPWGGWTPRCPGLGCVRWVHGPPGHPRSPRRCATSASFAEGRVRGQGAGSFPEESSAQEDTEQPGWGVRARGQQSLYWNPAWPPPGRRRRQAEGGGEQPPHPGGLTAGGFRVSCFIVHDPVWTLGVRPRGPGVLPCVQVSELHVLHVAWLGLRGAGAHGSG